jgi:hypothetical protein
LYEKGRRLDDCRQDKSLAKPAPPDTSVEVVISGDPIGKMAHWVESYSVIPR